ncbi:hypothetical protein SASPL_139081 [Salvia splendens]|uniref:Uncharacterized protein n=1 Tax=Salvia splendens TaxID=180675 RepID=A0A8X8ZER5_SALSN|nr:hypothetical protein SASPL_139081 [Salvia splendens]
MDKAAPLGHVVDHVKEQRQRAKEASKISSGVPSEIDEAAALPLGGREVPDTDEGRGGAVEREACTDGLRSPSRQQQFRRVDEGESTPLCSIELGEIPKT